MSISVSFTASRTDVISPAAIFFDASGTTSTLASTATRAFRQILYTWDLNDPTSGTWAYGADITRSRNYAKGMLAAHVYEIADGGGDKTFTPVLTATDGVSVGAYSAVTITVRDATGASGFATRYVIAADGDFTGAPAGTQVTQSNWFAILNNASYIGANHRVSLKCGNTFTCGTTAPYKNFSNWQIDSWVGNAGSAKPIVQATVDGIDFVHYGDNDAVQLQDVRYIGLDFQANGHASIRGITYLGSSGGVNAASNRYYNNLLFLRMNMDNNGVGNNFMTMQQTGVFTIDCTLTNLTYTSFSGGMINSAMLGNFFHQTATTDVGEGNLRWGNANKFLFSNNDVRGGADQRQHFKLHSQTGVPSTIILVSCNKFYDGTDQLIFRISPQNTLFQESINNFIVEDNWFIAVASWGNAVQLSATNGSVRNNVFDFTLGPNAVNISVWIYQEGAVAEPIPNDIDVYLNTIYSNLTNTAGDGFEGVAVDTNSAGATNITVRDNLGYAVNYSNKTMLFDPNSRCVSSNNVLVTNRGNTWVGSNGNGTGSFAVPTDFKLRSTDTVAKGQGVAVTVFNDFFAVSRPQGGAYDLGFSQFDQGGSPGVITPNTGILTATGFAPARVAGVILTPRTP